MCHRLCDLSTYGLKTHVREMITPPKPTIGHRQPLPFHSFMAVIHIGHVTQRSLVKWRMNTPGFPALCLGCFAVIIVLVRLLATIATLASIQA